MYTHKLTGLMVNIVHHNSAEVYYTRATPPPNTKVFIMSKPLFERLYKKVS